MALLVAFAIVGVLFVRPGLRYVFWPLTPTRQRLLSTALLVLSILLMSWPLAHQSLATAFASAPAGSPADSETTIDRYDATYRVAADGHLTATEVLTVSMPAGRHGIFRFFPVADPAEPHARLVPTITTVTMDDRPVPVSYSWRDDDRVYVAQIGDPDQTVQPGVHTYAIHYAIAGMLAKPPAAPGEFATHAGNNPGVPSATLYSNVVGFWAMPIHTARVGIDLPGPSGLVQCAADATGATPCAIAGAGTNRVTVTTESLPAQHPVTVRIDLQVPLPDRVMLPWTARFDRMLGRSWPTAKLVALLSAIAAGSGYLWARRSREPSPGFPVMYTPPDRMGPVQTVYLVKETVGDHAVVASLLYLAERKLVRLTGAGSQHWTLTGVGTPDQWTEIDPVTRKVGETLQVTAVDAVFRANGSLKAGEKLCTAANALTSSCASWARTEGYVVSAVWERAGRVAVVAALGLALVGFSGAFTATMWGLPFAGFASAGTGLLATGVGTRHTPSGRRLWSRAAGFERMLATPSAEERFDFSARRDLFTAYIPYAVAFGVADRWAAKYRTATGQQPPVPPWYPARSPGGAARLYSSGGFAGFDAAVAASISAYRSASARSSGSGGSSFSSSGGSWGGGGGGGGGTW